MCHGKERWETSLAGQQLKLSWVRSVATDFFPARPECGVVSTFCDKESQDEIEQAEGLFTEDITCVSASWLFMLYCPSSRLVALDPATCLIFFKAGLRTTNERCLRHARSYFALNEVDVRLLHFSPCFDACRSRFFGYLQISCLRPGKQVGATIWRGEIQLS